MGTFFAQGWNPSKSLLNQLGLDLATEYNTDVQVRHLCVSKTSVLPNLQDGEVLFIHELPAEQVSEYDGHVFKLHPDAGFDLVAYHRNQNVLELWQIKVGYSVFSGRDAEKCRKDVVRWQDAAGPAASFCDILFGTNEYRLVTHFVTTRDLNDSTLEILRGAYDNVVCEKSEVLSMLPDSIIEFGRRHALPYATS